MIKNKMSLELKNSTQVFSKKIWVEVVTAFTTTRTILLIVGWFAQYFPVNPNRSPEYISRGYAASPIRLLDIWVRSDSFYYMSIIGRGYFTRGNLKEVQSNWAFFPLYPYILKPILFFVLDVTKNFDWVLATGVVISNIFLFATLPFLYELINREFKDEEVARRSIWLLMVFPTSFFLSSLYAESLFLLLSVAGIYAICLRKWPIAALIASLLAITKSLGIVYWIILAISYNWRQPRWKEIAWFIIVPLGLAAFLFKAYWITGDPLSPFMAQMAWGKHLAWPWSTFVNKSYQLQSYLYFERLLMLGFLVLIPVMILKLPRQLVVYGVLVMIPIMVSGNLMAFGRHLVLDFPLIITIALLIKKKKLSLITIALLMLIQSVIMVGWAQHYNIW